MPQLSPMQQELAIAAVKVVVLFGALLSLFSGMTYVERRLLAFMQFRLGPNRTGPFGLLQPVADGIKLFFKEEVIPEGANKVLFVAAPAVAVITAFLAIAVVPWGGPVTIGGRVIDLQLVDFEVGVLYLFAISSLAVYSLVMAGWAANNKFTLIGGLRSSAQMFSYELALGLSWVPLIMMANSFRISDIVRAQDGWFWNWFFVMQPVAFLVYLVAGTAEANRTPFDLPEAETELVAGYHTEYSSMRFALLQMAEYVHMITISAVGANLFFGGWMSPIAPLPDGPWWFALKLGGFLFFFIWLRGTLPRFRYDQLMHFGWKVLVPLAAINIVVTGLVIVLVAR
jgi:NADH-quinone oxidoreductase subunit H